MKRILSLLALAAVAAFCTSLTACKAGSASETRPSVFRMAYFPQTEQLQGGGLRVELMRSYLEKQLHMPVDVVRVDGYAATVEAMRAEKIDMFSGSSLTYLLAAQKAGGEAIAARGFPDGTIGGYRSVIAVPKDSPIHSMQDLKAHAHDLVFAFAEPASTSGYLYPRVGLVSNGINPDTDFKKVIFSGNHLASALTIKAGKVDAGACMQSMLKTLVANHKMAPDDVRIIWTSDLIPNGPYTVRKALPEQLKQEVQAALVQMPARDPALMAHLNSLFHTSDSGNVIVPVTDATYDGLRKYASQVKDFNFEEK
jgi:phosphonate transport system substrate-binding protein